MRYLQQSDFFTVIQKQETTKLLITTVLLVRENLKGSANGSDSIVMATIYCGIALVSKS